jgi:hypothetical protein
MNPRPLSLKPTVFVLFLLAAFASVFAMVDIAASKSDAVRVVRLERAVVRLTASEKAHDAAWARFQSCTAQYPGSTHVSAAGTGFDADNWVAHCARPPGMTGSGLFMQDVDKSAENLKKVGAQLDDERPSLVSALQACVALLAVNVVACVVGILLLIGNRRADMSRAEKPTLDASMLRFVSVLAVVAAAACAGSVAFALSFRNSTDAWHTLSIVVAAVAAVGTLLAITGAFAAWGVLARLRRQSPELRATEISQALSVSYPQQLRSAEQALAEKSAYAQQLQVNQADPSLVAQASEQARYAREQVGQLRGNSPQGAFAALLSDLRQRRAFIATLRKNGAPEAEVQRGEARVDEGLAYIAATVDSWSASPDVASLLATRRRKGRLATASAACAVLLLVGAGVAWNIRRPDWVLKLRDLVDHPQAVTPVETSSPNGDDRFFTYAYGERVSGAFLATYEVHQLYSGAWAFTLDDPMGVTPQTFGEVKQVTDTAGTHPQNEAARRLEWYVITDGPFKGNALVHEVGGLAGSDDEHLFIFSYPYVCDPEVDHPYARAPGEVCTPLANLGGLPAPEHASQ